MLHVSSLFVARTAEFDESGARTVRWRLRTRSWRSPIESEGEYTIGVYFDAHGRIELAAPVPIAIYLAEAVTPVQCRRHRVIPVSDQPSRYAVVVHVAALLVAGSATIDDSAIDATRLPTTSYQVNQTPLWLTVPLVLVVHAPAGGDYDPELFIVCKDPGGTIRGTVRSVWQWPDEDTKSSKYRCFTPQLSFAVETTGEYTIGAYHDAEANRSVSTPIPLAITMAGGR